MKKNDTVAISRSMARMRWVKWQEKWKWSLSIVTLGIGVTGPVLTFDTVGDKMPLLLLLEECPVKGAWSDLEREFWEPALRSLTHVILHRGVWGARLSDEQGTPPFLFSQALSIESPLSACARVVLDNIDLNIAFYSWVQEVCHAANGCGWPVTL